MHRLKLMLHLTGSFLRKYEMERKVDKKKKKKKITTLISLCIYVMLIGEMCNSL